MPSSIRSTTVEHFPFIGICVCDKDEIKDGKLNFPFIPLLLLLLLL